MLANELSCHSPAHRIIALIDYLKTNTRNVCAECSKLLLTRQQIASMTGLRVETVIRVMKELEEQKMITIEKGKVYLL
jgi:CRP-like cAMP-binding protein